MPIEIILAIIAFYIIPLAFNIISFIAALIYDIVHKNHIPALSRCVAFALVVLIPGVNLVFMIKLLIELSNGNSEFNIKE